nr:MAG TPA: hypothetical protein [Caudoviricetes sp.]
MSLIIRSLIISFYEILAVSAVAGVLVAVVLAIEWFCQKYSDEDCDKKNNNEDKKSD